MFCAKVAMAEGLRFLYRQFETLLSQCCHRNLARTFWSLFHWVQGFDLLSNLIRLHLELVQRPGPNSLSLAHDREQQVFWSNPGMMVSRGFLVCQSEDVAGV